MITLGAGVLPAVMNQASAAPDDGSFTSLRGFAPTGDKVRVKPRAYAASRVDLATLRGELPTGTASSLVSIPDPSGALQTFRVVRTERMESELAAAHPEISTYSGRGVDDPGLTIALDLTPMGFHASVRSGGQGAWFVDPAYNRRGTTAHLSYYGKSLPAPQQRRVEGEVDTIRTSVDAKITADATTPDAAVVRKVYRLALTSDPSYAAYFGTDNVLAEKVTLMNRVNQIYNDDLAIDLRLVNATDALNLDTEAKATGVNGPCGAAPCFRLKDLGGPGADDDIPGGLDFCSGLTLGQNRTVLGQLVGASSYDIGHIALGKNGGGVAYLQVVGGDYKGGGCTGLPQPKGDFFAIDYVAHEMGHQFGGNHTFNGALGFCGGNISDASVEPGSGSSVMAYAGICGQDDLQPHTDPYFSFLTVDEATAYTEDVDYSNIEVQTVSLRDFDPATDTLSVAYGAGAPVAVATYSRAGIDAAVEAASGKSVSIAEWGFDEFGLSGTPAAPDATGFQVIFNSTPTIVGADATDVDLAPLSVTATGGATGFVGETAQGGPAFNAGYSPETVPPTGNTAPAVTAPADKTLPIRTPFALTGTGGDRDGDALVYLWEQTNFGEGTPLSANTKVYGPLFRVFGDDAVVTDEGALQTPSPGENIADDNTTRVFPDMAQILSGNTNAATGDCPPAADLEVALTPVQLDCYSEFLPDTDYLGSLDADDRQMDFRLTARDRSPHGGGLAFDDVTLTVDPAAGPFLVTSQAAADTTVPGGSSVPVTWAVNKTQGLAPTVRISLSTDGGATFGTVLAAATPNDGAESLTMPNVTAGDARLKIEAVGNYFFDVNDASFKLAATTPPTTPPTAPPTTPPGLPDTTITAGPANGSVVLDPEQTFRYASSVSPANFVCKVDGATLPCASTGLTTSFSPGTHLLSVAATNAAGAADATPATRTFTVPRDDGTFKRKGSWKRVRNAGAYGDDYLTSRHRGDRLTTRISEATQVSLVVSTRRDAGTIKVFIGRKRIKTFNLKGKNRTLELRTVELDAPASGKLKVVVGKDKPVRIEAVAVVTAAP